MDGDTVFEILSINIFLFRLSMNDMSSSVIGHWLSVIKRIMDIIRVASRKPQTPFSLTPSAYSDTKLSRSRMERPMDLYEAIMGRKSIRRFKPDHVPKEVPERIFEMATWVPSGMNPQNLQPFRIYCCPPCILHHFLLYEVL
jgi:hypothetical protein